MSLKDIALGRYVHGDSLLHGLDPRTKLLSLLFLSSLLFTGNDWRILGTVAAAAGAACMSSGLKAGFILRSLSPFKWLIIMAVILNMVFVGGHILVEAPLPYGGISREGVELGLLYGGRIALVVLMASLLTLTTEPITLVDGIEKLMGPLSRFGLKPHNISLSMVLTIRFIPILIDEAEKIRKSHIARGLRPDMGLRERIKSVSMLFLPLFHSSLRRVETLAAAMDCRMYQNDLPRTRYKEITMNRKDWCILCSVAVLTLGAAVI